MVILENWERVCIQLLITELTDLDSTVHVLSHIIALFIHFKQKELPVEWAHLENCPAWKINVECSFFCTNFIIDFCCFTVSTFTVDGDCSYEIKRRLLLGRKVMNSLDNILKSRHYIANKDLSSQGYGFSSGHVWMWELGCEESWAPKNWCFWTVVLEKTLESPLDCKEIQPVHYKGDQSWVFIGGTDAEAETPILGPHQAKSWFIGKDPDARRDWEEEEKGMTEDEMVGWHHRVNGHGFE